MIEYVEKLKVEVERLRRENEILRRESGGYLDGLNSLHADFDKIADAYVRDSGVHANPYRFSVRLPNGWIETYLTYLEALLAWRKACGIEDHWPERTEEQPT